ncbi:MAG: VacJ family lipoprotein [Wenzhouxiangellaceae bacterium]
MNFRRPFIVAALLGATLLAGCATTDMRAPIDDDPWEGLNRHTYAFNRGLDKALIKPIAQGYEAVTPEPVRQGIGNALTNLRFPVTIINLLLQGKIKDTGIALGRFALNSTFGLAGLVDVATIEGVPNYQEDFGQTLAVWGWQDSNYLVLPLLGPSTTRDALATYPERWTDGVAVLIQEENLYWLLGLNIIHQRSTFLSRENTLLDANDEYAFVRDAYLQRRDFLIKDGQTELPDYDEYLLDEEEFDDDYDADADNPVVTTAPDPVRQ